MNKAVVATSRGAQELGATGGQHLAIGSDAATFADEVVRLLRDASARRQMGTAACDFVVATHERPRFGAMMGDLLRRVAAQEAR